MIYKFWRLTNIIQKLVSHAQILSLGNRFLLLKQILKWAVPDIYWIAKVEALVLLYFQCWTSFTFSQWKLIFCNDFLKTRRDGKRIISINWLCFEKRRSRNATWPIFCRIVIVFSVFSFFDSTFDLINCGK